MSQQHEKFDVQLVFTKLKQYLKVLHHDDAVFHILDGQTVLKHCHRTTTTLEEFAVKTYLRHLLYKHLFKRTSALARKRYLT